MDLTAYADEYWRGKTDAVDMNRLRRFCSFVPKGARVLVVDAGPGMLPKLLEDEGFEVEMTDLSQHAVERALAKGLRAQQVDTDDDALPFPDASFDCVISDSAIEHRYWPGKAVGECSRVLRPGGTFLLLVPNIAHWRHRLQLLFGRLPETKGGPTDWCHLRFMAYPEMRKMVKSAGLAIMKVAGWPSLWVKGLYPSVFRAPGVSHLYRGLCWLRPQLFGRDIILVCTKPGA